MPTPDQRLMSKLLRAALRSSHNPDSNFLVCITAGLPRSLLPFLSSSQNPGLVQIFPAFREMGSHLQPKGRLRRVKRWIAPGWAYIPPWDSPSKRKKCESFFRRKECWISNIHTPLPTPLDLNKEKSNPLATIL